MHLVAKVFDLAITDHDISSESAKLIGQDSGLARVHALNRLIDRLLLLHEAQQAGIDASEDEFDSALLEALEEPETGLDAGELPHDVENRIRHRVIIQKHVRQLCDLQLSVSEDTLKDFYADQAEVFSAPESVRASHILIRSDVPDAEARIRDLRQRIHTPQDFFAICENYSNCLSGARQGDLGYFARGQMIPEIDSVAFALPPNQISDVFSSRFGYHILMVTDHQYPHQVPFEEIKDSLKARLIQLQREYYLSHHVGQLRKAFQDQIQILDSSYTLS